MEVGAGSAGFTPAAAAAADQAQQPRRVADQATRRAVARTEEAEAQREKRERDAQQRAADQGHVDIRA